MTACPICQSPFTTPKGVKQKQFCSTACRAAFHNGCRLIGQRLYEDGAISIEQIRAEVGLYVPSGSVNGDLEGVEAR